MFLLVPAHPGCPGQSPESHKMVVVVTFLLRYYFNLQLNYQFDSTFDSHEKLHTIFHLQSIDGAISFIQFQ